MVHENCWNAFCQFAQQTYKGGCLGLEPYLEVPVALGEAVEQSHTVPRRDDVQSFPGPSARPHELLGEQELIHPQRQVASSTRNHVAVDAQDRVNIKRHKRRTYGKATQSGLPP
jgi:hypothetical protein